MKKIKTYTQHVYEAIRMRDHKILDPYKAEELMVALSSVDERVAEVTPANAREWLKFTNQLDLLYKIIEEYHSEGKVPPYTPAQKDLSDYDSTYLQAYVLEQTGTEFKHSVFELLRDWWGISPESRKQIESLGFYPKHFKEEIVEISKRMAARAKMQKNVQKIGPSMEKAVEALEDLNNRINAGEDVLGGLFAKGQDAVMRIALERYGDDALVLLKKFGRNTSDEVSAMTKWLRMNGYSPAMFYDMLDNVSNACVRQSEDNSEAKRTAGMQDWFRVKTGPDQNFRVTAPNLKAFMKSGYTKLYIDDIDAKYSAKYPEFDSKTANYITDIKFSARGEISLLPMFSMRTTSDTLKLHNIIRVEPVKTNGSGQVRIAKDLPFEAPIVKMRIDYPESVQWLIRNYKGGGWIVEMEMHGPYSHYTEEEFAAWRARMEPNVASLADAGFHPHVALYGENLTFKQYAKAKEEEIKEYRERKSK